jgi:Mn-dependent DtxR family transcriptional regulator
MDNPPHRCYASNKWLALQMGVEEKTVANMLSSLRKKKIVRQLKWDGRIRIIGIEKEAL